jgi:hypothetical protein
MDPFAIVKPRGFDAVKSQFLKLFGYKISPGEVGFLFIYLLIQIEHEDIWKKG